MGRRPTQHSLASLRAPGTDLAYSLSTPRPRPAHVQQSRVVTQWPSQSGSPPVLALLRGHGEAHSHIRLLKHSTGLGRGPPEGRPA
jgi:hypothetical protein